MTTLVSNAPSSRIAKHPVGLYFVLAYAISWGLWLPLVLGYDGPLQPVLFTAGVFGPPAAALLTMRLLGRDVGAWLRSVFRLRVPGRWWGVALGLPVLLTLVASGVYTLTGNETDWGLVPSAFLAYTPALALATLLGGGQEELGWRGFALHELEAWLGPIRATLVLGVLWGLWHLPGVAASAELRHGLDLAALLPVLGLTLLSVVGYAFLLTWVMNRTGSVLVAMLLHGGFNTANGALVPLAPETVEGSAYVLLSVLVFLTLAATVAALLIATKGRLGYHTQPFRLPDVS